MEATSEMVHAYAHLRKLGGTSSKNASQFDMDSAIGAMVNVHQQCLKAFQKRVNRMKAKVTSNPTDEKPSLHELARDGALRNHNGDFVYVHKAGPLDTLSPTSKAANEKCFYELIKQRTACGNTVVKARNTGKARPITLVAVTADYKKRKISNSPAKISRSAAGRQVNGVLKVAKLVGATKEAFEVSCSTKKATELHSVVAAAAGIKLKAFSPGELAALQTGMKASRSQMRLLTAYLVSHCGSWFLESGGCTEQSIYIYKV